jgi:hypothetical protein
MIQPLFAIKQPFLGCQVLKMSDWMCRRADEVADETFEEAGVLTAEEKDRHRTFGEYVLLEELGGGGMGRVFKAVHRKMDRTVAVKLVPESLVRSPESVERFQREVQALARLTVKVTVRVNVFGLRLPCQKFDGPQRRPVVDFGINAGQGERPGRRVPRAGDLGCVGK